MLPVDRNSWHRRVPLLLAVLGGAVAGGLVWLYYRANPDRWSDFDQLWVGARALLAGDDPYAAVASSLPWPLYYPLPAVLLAVPFAPFRLGIARSAFAALTATLAVWAILRHRPHAWPLLLTGPFLYALIRGQWAPLLVAGALLPWLGGIIAAKPTIGLATFAFRPARAALAGALALALISLALSPSWPATWLATMRHAELKLVPMLMPGGVILLAAAGRWGRPEARLLAALACVPQTPSHYELFPMALVPATRRQAGVIGLCWNLLFYFGALWLRGDPVLLTPANVASGPHFYWPLHFVLGYIPALFAVLIPSPLVDRPPGYPAWSPARQRAYRVVWGAVLGLVGAVTVLWVGLIAWSFASSSPL